MPLQNSPQETARSNVCVLSAGHYTTHAWAIEKGGKNVCQNNKSKPQKRVLAIRKQLMKSNKAMQKGLGREWMRSADFLPSARSSIMDTSSGSDNDKIFMFTYRSQILLYYFGSE
jgi:hypothetical protein